MPLICRVDQPLANYVLGMAYFGDSLLQCRSRVGCTLGVPCFHFRVWFGLGLPLIGRYRYGTYLGHSLPSVYVVMVSERLSISVPEPEIVTPPQFGTVILCVGQRKKGRIASIPRGRGCMNSVPDQPAHPFPMAVN